MKPVWLLQKQLNMAALTRVLHGHLLARLYLNAKTYTGTTKYTEAITYAKKVIGAGYTLQPITPNYSWLIMINVRMNLCLLLIVMVCAHRLMAIPLSLYMRPAEMIMMNMELVVAGMVTGQQRVLQTVS